MKKPLFTLLLFFLLSSHVIAQDDAQYIQVNSGTDIVINSGQSAYIVLQVNNPSADTLIGVEILCTVDTVSGSTRIDEDNTQAYILDTVEFTDSTATFGADADIDLATGQSGNVQFVVSAEASDTDIAKALITCDFFADNISLDSVEIELSSTDASSTNSNDNSDDSGEATTSDSSISINNGSEIRIATSESIELVIQVGNTGQTTMENAVVTCSIDMLDGELAIVEDRTDARSFVSYVIDGNTVIFGEGEEVSLVSGQNMTVALGIEFASDTERSPAAVGCSVASDGEQEASDPDTAVISNRDNQATTTDESGASASTDDNGDTEGSLSINNGSEMMIGNGQSAELVLQFGNSSETTLDAVSIICSISNDEGVLNFSDERTNTYNAGEYVIEDSTLIINIDREMPQGQNMNVAVGIQVDEANTEGSVSCELSNNGDVLGSDIITISGN